MLKFIRKLVSYFNFLILLLLLLTTTYLDVPQILKQQEKDLSILNNKDYIAAKKVAKRKGLFGSFLDYVKGFMLCKQVEFYYSYERLNFSWLPIFKTKKGLIKMKMKTVSYEYHSVWNDIKGTHFNGLKTFRTENTTIHKVYRKFQKAKPMKALTWIYKRVKDFLPKVKDFFNMTGGNTTYKTVQFSVNPKTKEHTYAHNLKNFSEVKKWIIEKGKDIFKNFFTNNKKPFVSKSFRKRYRFVDTNGYHFKLNNRKIFAPYKKNKNKKFVDNSLVAKQFLHRRTWRKRKFRSKKTFLSILNKTKKIVYNFSFNIKNKLKVGLKKFARRVIAFTKKVFNGTLTTTEKPDVPESNLYMVFDFKTQKTSYRIPHSIQRYTINKLKLNAQHKQQQLRTKLRIKYKIKKGIWKTMHKLNPQNLRHHQTKVFRKKKKAQSKIFLKKRFSHPYGKKIKLSTLLKSYKKKYRKL